MASTKRCPDLSDFKALYEDSLQLTSTIDDYGIPPLQRGIEQLDEASRSLKEKSSRSISGNTQTKLNKAHFLLAGKGFDAEKLSRELNAIELKASYEPLEPLGDTDIDGYLRHHHDMIVVTALEEAKENYNLQCDKRMMSYIQDEWDLSKKRLLEDLGYKAAKYSLPESLSQSTSSLSSVRSRKRQVDAPLSLKSSTDTLTYTAPKSINAPRSSEAQSGLTDSMRRMIYVIQSLNKTRQENMRTSFDLITEFVKTFESMLSPNVIDSKQQRTYKCWQLLRSMLHGGKQNHKSLVEEEFGEDYRNNSTFLESYFIDGSREFLELLFKTYLTRTVEASQISTDGYPGLEGLIRTYVKLKYDSKNLPLIFTESPLIDGVPLWPQVYYCIRSGGTEEAISLINKVSNTDESGFEDALIEALNFQLNQKKSKDSAKHKMSFASLNPECFQILNSMYNRLASSRDSLIDPFKKTLANIFGKVNPNSSENDIVNTVEDFMWYKSCFCDPSSNDATYSINKLSETIRRFGPKHFDRDSTTPMVYFMVLLIAQEFERAIEYLCSKGCILEAVHFAIVMHHYGILYTSQSSRGGSDMKSANDSGLLVLTGQGQPAGRPLFNISLLIRQYVHSFALAEPREAVEYIVLLRDTREKHMLLVQLLLDTKQFKLLIGKMGTDGIREDGFLDTYLSKEDVADVIVLAGRFSQETGDNIDAFEIYLCAGNIEQVVSICCSQMGQVLCPPHPSREMWKEKAYAFTQQFLVHPWAKDQIAQNHSLGLTFQTLLNLMMFFDWFQENKWDEAINFLDSMNLLPAQDDYAIINRLVQNFMILDEPVRMNFHKLLLAYMTCIYQLAQNLRSENYASGSNMEQLSNLRGRAKALVTFSGSIKFRLPEGVAERLNRIEVMMM